MEAIMRIKLSVGLLVIFLLILISCSIFEDPNPVDIIGPEEGDILIKGDSFWVFAEVSPNYGVYSVFVELLLVTEDSMYDSTLWECNLLEQGISVQSDFSIAKELTVPLDAPADDNYTLQVVLSEGGSGRGNSVPVKVRSSSN
jgi:hypothetical protein